MLRCRDMEFTKEFKDYVGNVVCYLRRKMYLGEYSMSSRYVDKHQDDSDNGGITYAMINVDDSYLTANLTVFGVMMEWYNDGDLHRVAHTLLHEMCHLLTEPLWYWARYDASPSQEPIIRRDNERQVQRIANVIGWLLPDDWYYPEKVAGYWDKDDYYSEKDDGNGGDSMKVVLKTVR